MSTPAVLPGSIAAARFSTSSSGQQLRQLCLDCLQLPELADVGQLHRLDGAVGVLGEDQRIDDADGPAVNQFAAQRPSRP